MSIELGETGAPWYRNSWPWFIVILLSVSVIASVTTVVIAYRYGDAEVRQTERIEAMDDSNRVTPARSD